MQKLPKSQTYDIRTRRNSKIFSDHQRNSVNPFVSQNPQKFKHVVKKSIKLNLKKLPKDWFSPKKDFENLSSRQNLQTDKNTDSLPSLNPSIQLPSQRIIHIDNSEDLMKKTSYFRSSLQKRLKNKIHTTQCEPQAIMMTQRQRSTALFELSQPINRLKYQKFRTEEIQKNHQTKCKNSSRLGTSQSNLHKLKNSSVPKIKNRVFQLKLPLIQQCKMTPTFKKAERNISQKGFALFRSKQLVPHKDGHSHLLICQDHCKISILSDVNNQQISNLFSKKYPRRSQSQREFGPIQLVKKDFRLSTQNLQNNRVQQQNSYIRQLVEQ